jgi:hypothetical protein
MKKFIAVLGLLMIATTVLAWDGTGWDSGKKVVTTKTASFTVATNDDVYLLSTAGGAITATLPSPATCTNKEWTVVLTAAAGAVTFNAGTFSINGAVTDANMDAVGDSFQIICTGSAYLLTSRYIH